MLGKGIENLSELKNFLLKEKQLFLVIKKKNKENI